MQATTATRIGRSVNNMSAARATDAAIARLAGNQYGLISARQLRELGVSRHRVRTNLLRLRWQVVFPRVYAIGPERSDVEARWMAATLAADCGVVSHRSAAVLWQVWRRSVRDISITHRWGRHRGVLRGIQVHRGSLAADEVTVVRGIPVTTLPRTLVDLCSCMTPHQLAAVLHEAAYLDIYDRSAIDAMRKRYRGRRHSNVLRSALEIFDTGSAGTRSALEDRLLVAIQAAGITMPQVNVHIRTSGKAVEVDFCWRQQRLCVEVDGPGHERPLTRTADEQRDAGLRAAGYRVLRIPWYEIRPDASRALDRIYDAFRHSAPVISRASAHL